MERDDVLFWLFAFFLFGGGITLWLAARKLPQRWKLWSARILATCLCCTAIALLLFGVAVNRFDLNLYFDVNYPSPDGGHLARLRYVQMGALGDDMVLVQLRTNWFHSWQTAQKLYGTRSDGYTLEWRDGGHLRILHPAIMVSTDHGLQPYQEQPCDVEVEGVHIVCGTF